MVSLRGLEWYRDQSATKYTNTTITTSSAMGACGRVVIVTTDLILDLETISEISTGRDGAIVT